MPSRSSSGVNVRAFGRSAASRLPHSSPTLTTARAACSKSARFASKYSSIVPWKSRWSCVRFVKTSTANRVPSRRPCVPAIDVASIAHDRSPASSISRNSRCRSIDSGVLSPVGRSAAADAAFDVRQQRRPPPGRLEDRTEQERRRRLAVRARDRGDLELCATDRRRRSQRPAPSRRGRSAPAPAGRATSTCRSTISATAPAATAAPARSCPSTLLPLMQKKSAPRVTERGSYARSLISTDGAPAIPSRVRSIEC